MSDYAHLGPSKPSNGLVHGRIPEGTFSATQANLRHLQGRCIAHLGKQSPVSKMRPSDEAIRSPKRRSDETISPPNRRSDGTVRPLKRIKPTKQGCPSNAFDDFKYKVSSIPPMLAGALSGGISGALDGIKYGAKEARDLINSSEGSDMCANAARLTAAVVFIGGGAAVGALVFAATAPVVGLVASGIGGVASYLGSAAVVVSKTASVVTAITAHQSIGIATSGLIASVSGARCMPPKDSNMPLTIVMAHGVGFIKGAGAAVVGLLSGAILGGCKGMQNYQDYKAAIPAIGKTIADYCPGHKEIPAAKYMLGLMGVRDTKNVPKKLSVGRKEGSGRDRKIMGESAPMKHKANTIVTYA